MKCDPSSLWLSKSAGSAVDPSSMIPKRMLALAMIASLVATDLAVNPGTANAATDAQLMLAPTQPTVNLCGVVDARSVMALQSPTANPTVKALVAGVAPAGLTVSGGRLYVLDASRLIVTVHDRATGALQTTMPLAGGQPVGLAVDPAGNVYVSRYPYTIVKYSPNGAELWTRTVGAQVTGLYGQATTPGWRVGAVMASTAKTALFDADGAAAGVVGVTGNAFTAVGSDLVATDGRYVRIYDSTAASRWAVGAKLKDNDPMPAGSPLHFYQQGGAVRLPDGTVLVADGGRGIVVLSPAGIYQGVADSAKLGGITQMSSMATDGVTLWYASGPKFSGNQAVSSVPVADVLELAARPRPVAPRMGYGAGLVVDAAPGKFYAPGQTPRVHAEFDGWWARHTGLSVEYSVRDRQQILDGAVPPVARKVVSVPSTGLSFDLDLPVAKPGFYEVDARLLQDGKPISGTCVNYGVAAPGQTLDLSTLPGGANAGGPDPARGVALADVLGTGLFRDGVDWRFLLRPNAADPLDFSKYDAAFAAGARESAARGVPFVVQVGSGGPEKALVANGTWGARVRELVAHYADTVDYWEAWNEPNITYGSGASFVTDVLKPFYAAVRSADPTAKVVGGDPVNISVPYWQAIAAAGGFDYLDIVGIHPYTGHNRSFEEEGSDRSMGQLRALMTQYGAQGKPIWATEQAWWSNGPANYFSQGDFSARAMLWYRKWGVERWSYFLAQGTWGNSGVTFSAIEGSDYVKPAAAALMTVKTQTASRPYLGMVSTGIPNAFVQQYGSDSGGSDAVLAMWTDDLPVGAAIQQVGGTAPATVTVVDVHGASRPVSLPAAGGVPLQLDGAPQYLRVPAGVQVSVVPLQQWGPNLALQSSGAVASASTSGSWNPAFRAIDGVTAANTQGDFRSSPAWASAPGDGQPALTVTLPTASVIDRAVVSTVHLGSVLTGIAAYTVSARRPDGTWVEVARRDRVFHQRSTLVSFEPITATAVRVTARAINFSGYAGGVMPHFWVTDPVRMSDPTQANYGPAIIRELELYAVAPKADSSAPTAPAMSFPPTVARDAEGQVLIKGAAEAGSEVFVTLASGELSRSGNAVVGPDGSFSLLMNATGLPAGAVTSRVFAVDLSGNVGTAAEGFLLLDSSPVPAPMVPAPMVPAPTIPAPTIPAPTVPIPVPAPAPVVSTNVPPAGSTSSVSLLSVSSELRQRSPAGGPYARPLRIRVIDGSGRPAQGVEVTFAARASGPTVGFPARMVRVRTSSAGWAQSPRPRAGSRVGIAYVVASTRAGAKVTFRLTVDKPVVAVRRSRLMTARAPGVLPGWVMSAKVAGRYGVPTTARAIIVRVSAPAIGSGAVALGAARRAARADQRILLGRGRTSTLVVAPLGRDGRVYLANRGRGRQPFTVDVLGWTYQAGLRLPRAAR